MLEFRYMQSFSGNGMVVFGDANGSDGYFNNVLRVESGGTTLTLGPGRCLSADETCSDG